MIYIPRIKEKGFCPNPVARWGIPKFADSISFPEVEGTTAHDDWWNEQFELCVDGYFTGGTYIPGRYYYYLNFCYIGTVGRGFHHPDYVDYDLEYAELVEEAKRTKKGIIGLKRRRAGFSEKWVNMVGSYGLRFQPFGYSAGIVAGLSIYSEELGKKLANTNHLMAPELNLHIPKGADDWEIYWTEEMQNKKGRKAGSFGKVKIRTANSNPGIMKGERYDDVAFEESGEFDLLETCFGDTKSCFAVGDMMIGTPYIYGTGGNVAKGSKGFRSMWHNPDTYNLLKTEAFAGRLRNKYYIGSINTAGKEEYECPNILKIVQDNNLSIEQVLGCEDVEHVMYTKRLYRAELLKRDSKVTYYKELQTDPFDAKEAFLKFNANQYPLELIAAQEAHLLTIDQKKYSCYKPSWKLNKDGTTQFPLAVELELIDEPDSEIGDYIMIANGHHPKKIKNLCYGGIDSYDIDSTQTSKSLGAMVVLYRPNNVPACPSYMPIMIIFCRPKRKERFYELCGMASVLFDLNQSSMIDARSPGIIDWYKRNGLTKYLAKRPQTVESDHSEQMHDYGYKQTTFSKPISIGYVQTWCLDVIDICPFPQMLADIRDYDETQGVSDWDLHDALQNALIGIKDKPIVALRNGDNNYDPYELSMAHDPSFKMENFETSASTKQGGQFYDPWSSW